MLNKGYKINQIAIRLGETYNAIKYEVVQHSRIIIMNDQEENGPDAVTRMVYDANTARHKAYTKGHLASFRGKKILGNPALHQFVDRALLSFRSLEAIVGSVVKGYG